MVRLGQQVRFAMLVVVAAACTVEATGGREDRVDAAASPGGADASASAADAASTPPVDAADEGDCPRARVVTSGINLNVREQPNTSSEVIGSLPNGSVVPVLDLVQGESVQGNTEWFQIDDQGTIGFISGTFAECTTDAALTEPRAPYDVSPDGVG
jgi:uncharacterized protein YgiM (DUF1202 family)